MGYIYKADVYCDACGDALRAQLASVAPEDTLDHSSYDSDDYPKAADVEHDESDVPEHCARCGKFLHNPLTSAGYRNIKERLDSTDKSRKSELDPVMQAWANWYGFTYWTAEDCADDKRHSTPGWYSPEAY